MPTKLYYEEFYKMVGIAHPTVRVVRGVVVIT
jgi:hypothetical protein